MEYERGEDVACLLTTDGGTAPSPRVLHQAVPNESGRVVEKFFDHWRPDLGIFLNAPERPVLISGAADRNVPLFLAATRRAETAARPRLPILNAAVLNCFARCLAASAADAEAFRRQGMDAATVEVTGPLSDISVPLHSDPADHDALRRAIGSRPVWLAALAAPEELSAIETAHRAGLRLSHRLLLIVAANGIAPSRLSADLAGRGWQVAEVTIGAAVDPQAQILVGDPDDLGLYLRVAPITLAGGTFTDDAPAADPFAPALLGSALVHGPRTQPFVERYRRLDDGQGAMLARDTEELPDILRQLMAPDRAAEFAHAGWSVTSEAAPVIDRLVTLSNLVLDGERPG